MVNNLTKLGNVKVIYLADGKKQSAGGKGEDMGSFIKVTLNQVQHRSDPMGEHCKSDRPGMNDI